MKFCIQCFFATVVFCTLMGCSSVGTGIETNNVEPPPAFDLVFFGSKEFKGSVLSVDVLMKAGALDPISGMDSVNIFLAGPGFSVTIS